MSAIYTRPGTAFRCYCGRSTAGWPDAFCPLCGRHNDALYAARSHDRRPRTRRQIVLEYRLLGLPHLADRAMTSPPWTAPAPVPSSSRRRFWLS